MSNKETIVLAVVILISVYLLYLLIKYEVKKKGKTTIKKAEKVKPEKDEKPNEETKKVAELEKVEEKSNLIVEEKKDENNKQEKVPAISIALQDELREFQDYLKERITPEQKTAKPALHPYDKPRFSALDDFSYSNYDENESVDDFSFLDRRATKQDGLENLPNEIKILMMTDFFDTKF